jgi:hypothetical protein
MRDRFFLGVLFLWIWAVSMVDHYYTIKLACTINEEERNPIGKALLAADDGNPALFMTVKMMSLWVIFFATIRLYYLRREYAYFTLGTMAVVQLLLVMQYFKI